MATLLVAVCPIAIVWWLRASGVISSAVLGLGLGITLSLFASFVGCLLWEKRSGSEDLLFSELMIWGYLHRWRTERRLASALDLLGPMNEAQGRSLDGMSTKEQAKLLGQLVARMETRDPYLHGHSRRVARHSWMIARRMGLPRADVARIRTAAAIHDVGKINTPKAILHKPGPLTDDEYDVIKMHPGDGASMADVLRDAELTSIIRHHHERLGGTGYPDGLSGAQIPLGARIIAVADTFDAVTSERSYRPATPHKRAIDILEAEAGVSLDAAVVRAFCGHYAGRGPIALWSSLAGLPERVISWLASSAATVASAAKVVAVGALVGGAAVTSATLGLPVDKHHPTQAHRAGALRRQTQTIDPTIVKAAAPAPRAGAPISRGSERHGTRAAQGRPSAVAPATSPGRGDRAQPSAIGESRGQGPGPVKGKPEEPVAKGKLEAPPAKGKPEEPVAKGKPTEPPAKGKPEAPPASGKPEAPVAKGKPEAPPASGKPEAPPASGKPEAPTGKGAPAEPPAKGKP